MREPRSRRAPSPETIVPFAQQPCNECSPMVDAIHRHAAAMEKQAEAMVGLGEAVRAAGAHVEKSVRKLEPVGEFFAGASDRLDRLCDWFKKWLPRLALWVPFILMMIGMLQPSGALLVKHALTFLLG